MKLTQQLFLSLLIATQFATATVQAAKISEDKLQLGNPSAPSTDKVLEFNLGSGASNPKIKVNASTAKIQFAHDGSNFKDIGTGGGATRNYADTNPDAEGGTTGWLTYDDSLTFATTDVNTGTDTITVTGWSQTDGTPVSFVSSTTLPSGILAATTYYTVNTSGTSFKISTTLGGSALDITSQGSGTHTLMPGVPIDGTGGSPTITWTSSSSSPLRGLKSFLWTHGSTNQMGQGVCFAFTADSADLASVLQFAGEYAIASGTYVSSITSPPTPTMTDIQAYLIDVTAGSLIPMNGAYLPGGAAGLKISSRPTAQTHSSHTSYKYCFHQSLPSQSAYTAKFDAFSWGPHVLSQASFVGDWQAYTPTFTGFGTVSSSSMFYRQVGDSYELMGKFASGTPTATEARMSLPNGRVSDSAKIPSIRKVGHASRSAINPNTHNVLSEPGVGYVTFSAERNTSGFEALTKQNGDNFIANGDSLTLFATIPIYGLGTSLLTQDQSSEGRIAALYAVPQNPTGTLNSSVNVAKFGTVTKDSFAVYDTSTGVATVKLAGWYFATANLDITAASASVGSYQITHLLKNGTFTFGTGNAVVGSTSAFEQSSTASGLVYANVGDTIGVYSQTNKTTPSFTTNLGGSNFSLFLLSGNQQVLAGETVNARYTTSGTQTVTHGNTDKITTLTVKDYDSHSVFTSSSYPIPTPGTYRITGKIQYQPAVASTGNTESTELYLYKNGSFNRNIAIFRPQTTIAAGVNVQFEGTTSGRFVAGDILDFRLLANTATSNSAIQSAEFIIERTGN